MRRPAATARSMCSKPCVSTRPPGSNMRIPRRCGYSAATRPRLSHMPAMMCAISASESPGNARPMLSRARLETPSRRPIARASAPPIADAQSSGNNPKAPKHSAAPQPSSRWMKPIGRRGPRRRLHPPRSLGTLSRKRLRGPGRSQVVQGAGWVRVASRSVGTGHAPRRLLSNFSERGGIAPADFDLENLDGGPLAAGTRTMSFAVVIKAGSAPVRRARSSRSISPCAVRVMVGKRPSRRRARRRAPAMSQRISPARPIPAKASRRAPASRSPATGCRTAWKTGRAESIPRDPDSQAAPRHRAAQRRRHGKARGPGSRATVLPASPGRCRSHMPRRRRGATRSWRSRGSEIRHRARPFCAPPRLRRGRRRLGRAPPSTAPLGQQQRLVADRGGIVAGGIDPHRSAEPAAIAAGHDVHRVPRETRCAASARPTGVLPAPPATRLPTHITGTGGQ